MGGTRTAVRSIARASAFITLAVGGVTLFGWGVGLDRLRRLYPQLPPMKANLSICFVLSGAALLSLPEPEAVDESPRVARALGFVLAGLGALTFALAFTLDDAQLRELPLFGGVFSANVALVGLRLNSSDFCVLASGLALALFDRRVGRLYPAQWMIACVSLLSLLGILANVYQVSAEDRLVAWSLMAPHTAVTFAIFSLGALLTRPQRAPVHALINDTAAAHASRSFLLMLLVVLPTIGWIRSLSIRAGVYDNAFGLTLSVLLSVILLSALAIRTTSSLYRLELRNREILRELAESEESLATTLQSIGDAVISTDIEGRIVRMNPLSERLTGWRDAEARHRSIDEVLALSDPETDERVANPLHRALADGAVSGFANPVVLTARDGTRRIIGDSAAPVRNREGKLTGGVMVFRDQTERHHAQEALKQSEERFRTLAQTSSEVIWMADAGGHFATPQRSWEAYTGQSWSEQRDEGAVAMVHPEDRAAVRASWVAALRSRTVFRATGRLWHAPSQSYRRYVTCAAPIVDPSGVLREWIGTITDIEEQQLARDLTRMNEHIRRDRALIQAISEAQTRFITAGSSEDVFDRFLRSFLELTGSECGFIDEVMNDDADGPRRVTRAAIQPATVDPSRCAQLSEEVSRRGSAVLELPSLPRPDAGAPAGERLLGLPLYFGRELVGVLGLTHAERAYDDGTIEYLTPLVRSCANVIAALRSEELRRSADDEVRRLLEGENLRVREASRLKSEFLANMSHELRTPLNAIIGFAELLYDEEVGPVAPQQREFLGDILTSGKHLLQLISDILDLSKIEAGRMNFHPEALSVERVVSEVRSVLRTTAQSKKIRLSVEVTPDLTDFVVDGARLKQVLYNYLSNAIKFTAEGGRVAVRASKEPTGALRIEVEDTGVGIAPADLQRLFTDFLQLDASAAKAHGGTGLGLALTRRIVEAQGGAVGVRSALGEGSVFWAVIPQQSLRPRRASIARGNPVPRSPSEHERVLLLQGGGAPSAALLTSLDQASLRVTSVTQIADALAQCQAFEFCALVLDVARSTLDDFESLLRACSEGDRAVVPPLVFAGDTPRGATGLPVFGLVLSPFEPSKLESALRRVGLRPATGAVVMVLDPDQRTIERNASTLEALGYKPSCHSRVEPALAAAELERPLAVLVDASRADPDGFELVGRLREAAEDRTIPAVILTMDALSRERVEGVKSRVEAALAEIRVGDWVAAALRSCLRPTTEEAANHG